MAHGPFGNCTLPKRGLRRTREKATSKTQQANAAAAEQALHVAIRHFHNGALESAYWILGDEALQQHDVHMCRDAGVGVDGCELARRPPRQDLSTHGARHRVADVVSC